MPIPRALWAKKQHCIQRRPKTIFQSEDKYGKTHVIPVTDSGYCPFLKEDLKCAIYEDRPDLCKKFGDESHPAMCCPMQDNNGNPRDKE